LKFKYEKCKKAGIKTLFGRVSQSRQFHNFKMAPATVSINLEDPSTTQTFSEDEVEMVMDRTIKFGRYKTQDRTIGWILENDPLYFIWMANKMVEDGYGDTKTCRIYSSLIKEKIPIDRTNELIQYGQYRGKTYQWLLSKKTSYFLWLLEQKKQTKPFSNETRFMESLMTKH